MRPIPAASHAAAPPAGPNHGRTETDEDGDEEDEGVEDGGSARLAPAEAARAWAVAQLCGAATLPGAGPGVRGRCARWLAAAGLLELEGAAPAKVGFEYP